MSAPSGWARGLWERLQDPPDNEAAWSTLEEARNEVLEEARTLVQDLYDDDWLQDDHTKLIREKLKDLKR